MGAMLENRPTLPNSVPQMAFHYTCGNLDICADPWLLCTRKDARKAGLRKSGQRAIGFESLFAGENALIQRAAENVIRDRVYSLKLGVSSNNSRSPQSDRNAGQSRLTWIKSCRGGASQIELLLQEIRMSSNRRLKQGRAKDEKAARTIRSTGKRGKRARAEELSPEQRVELAQRIEAKEFRGKPPSI